MIKKTLFIIPALMAMASKPPAPFYPCYEVFMKALMEQESGGNPRAVLHENIGDQWCEYHKKIGVDSLGAYQVSLQDKGPRYKCNFTDRESVFDLKNNRDCADKILAQLHKEFPNDANWSQTGGRYFSTLRSRKDWPKYYRDNPDFKGYDNFIEYARRGGCVIK